MSTLEVLAQRMLAISMLLEALAKNPISNQNKTTAGGKLEQCLAP